MYVKIYLMVPKREVMKRIRPARKRRIKARKAGILASVAGYETVEYMGQMDRRIFTLVEEICNTQRADPDKANISSIIRAMVIKEVHDDLEPTNASIQERNNMLTNSLSHSGT